jgi:nucleoside-diphosphate-sugar epimerase
MNIVVTGSNGFLGSNVCELLSKEHKILALSRKNDKLYEHDNLSFLQCEFVNILKYKSEIKKFKPDILIHCAWLGGNNYLDLNSFIQYDSVNYSFEILKLFSECGISRFIGFGAGSEYGYHTTKVSENDTANPYNLYGHSKHYFKSIAEKFCEINDINFSWVIPMYTYGYNDVLTRFIPTVINKCLANEDIILNSCKSYTDYLFVEDFTDGLNSIISFELNGTYNISSGSTYNSKDIVQMIARMTNYKKEIIFDLKKDRINFQDYFCGSSYKLQTFSDWKPKTSMEQGLLKTINWTKGINCIKTP